MVSRNTRFVSATIVFVVALQSGASACPFCSRLGKTLSEEAGESEYVAAGNLKNPRAEGITDFEIETLIKADRGPTSGTATLTRYLPAAKNAPALRVVFADVVDDGLDPFRVMPVRSDAFVDYFRHGVESAKKPPAEKLAYFFQFLEHPDAAIASDAYQEFAKSPFHDVIQARDAYDPDRLLAFLRDPLTPGDRVGLYGLLTGIVGRDGDDAALREMVEDPAKRRLGGLDGVMGGYCVMDPSAGPEFVLKILADETNGFNLRYSALEAIRFALAELPVERETVLDGLADCLAVSELADLIVDELRKQKRWQELDVVLALPERTGYGQSVLESAVLRFAIECPGEQAKAYVAEIEAQRPRLVEEVKEGLAFEKQLIEQFGTGPKAPNESRPAR